MLMTELKSVKCVWVCVYIYLSLMAFIVKSTVIDSQC